MNYQGLMRYHKMNIIDQWEKRGLGPDYAATTVKDMNEEDQKKARAIANGVFGKFIRNREAKLYILSILCGRRIETTYDLFRVEVYAFLRIVFIPNSDYVHDPDFLEWMGEQLRDFSVQDRGNKN